MKSFRTELENPIVEKDILDLEKKIAAFQNGEIDEDRFRSLRLARGVYGQRQAGVQMVRIKIPYGHLSIKKLLRICDVADTYSTGNLHITTRQDIQIHYVSLDHTPQLWAELEIDGVTLREACGNTVRNITASAMAGIDPNEPFDVTPYADAFFKYFLRNPICQDMGRKFKIAFSSSDADDSLSYMHDLGFIPKIQNNEKGFKVMLGGGLGSQPYLAEVGADFLAADKIIPFTECVLRVFDRYGERTRRNKARMKYLLQEVGLAGFKDLIAGQTKALSSLTHPISDELPFHFSLPDIEEETPEENTPTYQKWLNCNVFPQKQNGYYAVGLKITTGDISTENARKLVHIIQKYAADDFRLGINQGLLIRYVKKENIPAIYNALKEINLATPGYDTLFDITTCPGTDTCNLGIASSMGLARELERMLKEEYGNLVKERNLKIKISGCMNACGQHTIANIGFQGMTIKAGQQIAPASQILLGGGTLGDGAGRFADKVLKVPSKRSPEVLKTILDDFYTNSSHGELFNNYYDRKGTSYFYDMLKHFSDVNNLNPSDYIDWGNKADYVKEIGIGECASVIIDLVATLLIEAKEAIHHAKTTEEAKQYADAIYYAYNAMIYAAKALLTTEDKVRMNTQNMIVKEFDLRFVHTNRIKIMGADSFEDLVYQINQHAPTKTFANTYISNAEFFVDELAKYRESMLLS